MMSNVERYGLGQGGWIRYAATDLEGVLFVRFTHADDGRLQPVDLFLEGDRHLSASMLRQLPLSKIEAEVNGPAKRKLLEEGLNLPGPDLRTAASYYSSGIGSDDAQHWAAQMLGSQVDGSDIEPAPRLKHANAQTRPHRAPSVVLVEVPAAGGRYPDEFYEGIARVYTNLVAESERPAADIADANHVPVTTVHRWIKEARRRGFLAAGRRGRAG